MFQPESDWRGQDREGVAHFSIDRSFSKHDAYADIRRFHWVSASSGLFSPARHYLDFSLIPQTRRSRVRAEGWSESCYSGEVLYLPPNRRYHGEPALEERQLLCVALGDEFLGNILEDARPFDLAPCADVKSPSLRRLMEGLAIELNTPGFASDILIEANLVGIAVELARALQRRDDCPRGLPAASRQIRVIHDFILANLSSPLSVSEIARECGMSTRHVARVFKASTGLSIGDFVARSRISLAKDLLGQDDARIKEVSWRCGFQSTSAFCAAFRTATGKTPSEFRQSGNHLQ